MNAMENKIIDTFLGFAVGDALGVPVEFLSRETISQNPVTTMRGYGTHQQPTGTWSDDSSMAFCLAESLCNGYNVMDIANKFVQWYSEGYWTPHGKIFDIGIATLQSLKKVKTGTSPLISGGITEKENGNGSLMRILPLMFYLKDKPIKQRYEIVSEVSAITHAHIRSIFSCFIYTEFALELLKGAEKNEAYRITQQRIKDFLQEYSFLASDELVVFRRILETSMQNYTENEIHSSGYVIHTLEASLWCFFTTDTYADAVLKAVNLGSDTDTTGCVTGGLAGLYYGENQIPEEWKKTLVKSEEIIDLAVRFGNSLK